MKADALVAPALLLFSPAVTKEEEEGDEECNEEEGAKDAGYDSGDIGRLLDG